MNKKLVLILTLLSLTTIIKACDDDKIYETTSTSCTQSTDQYRFEEAKKAIDTNYPEGLDVITRLKHKGFGPAQVLYEQIRLFEETKIQHNQGDNLRNVQKLMKTLSEDGLIPARSFAEQIERNREASELPESDYKNKLKIYEDLSNKGFALAQSMMGLGYLNGNPHWGIPQDIPKGVELLRRAAEEKESMACFVVGKMYWEGTHGLSRNKREAVQLLRQGSLLGYWFLKDHNID